MNKEEYLKLVKEVTPKENNPKDYWHAFLMGGLLGLLGEGIKLILVNIVHLPVKDATSWVLIIIIFMSCLMTALGFFDSLFSKYKCGLIIPISGFAHSIMSSCLDYKKDGMVTGLGANAFKLAGSVLLFGIASGFICAIIKVIING